MPVRDEGLEKLETGPLAPGCRPSAINTMLMCPFRRKLFIPLLCVLILTHTAGGLTHGLDNPTPSGTVITNRAEATYVDDEGTSYGTVSPTVTVSILAVATLAVTPDETESSAKVGPRERLTRVLIFFNYW